MLILSKIYSFFLWIRKYLYKNKCYAITHFPVPVTSVGNILAGGTGKTPLVCYLIKEALKAGHRPLILSRGYGRKEKKMVIVPPHAPLPSAHIVGDEPHLIKSHFPECTLLVHAKRAKMAKKHWSRLDCSLIILDDAFQHWSVKRDHDVVTIDSTRNLSPAHLLPLGLFREPLEALKRADAIVFTRTNEVSPQKLQDQVKIVEKLLTSPHTQTFPWKESAPNHPPPFFFAEFQHKIWKDSMGRAIDMKNIDASLLLLTGVGNPNSVVKMIQKQGMTIRKHLSFPDHYRLKTKDIRKIKKEMQSLNARIITTEKDFIRWKGQLQELEPCYLEVILSILPSQENHTVFFQKKGVAS